MTTSGKAQNRDDADWKGGFFECSVGICKSKSLGEADRRRAELFEQHEAEMLAIIRNDCEVCPEAHG